MDHKPLKKNIRLTPDDDISAMLEECLDDIGTEAGFSERDRFQLRLVLDELATNTVSYGFNKGQGKSIDIEVHIEPDSYYEVTYSDDAPGFDPVNYIGDNQKSGTEERDFGGFGISLVKKLMDTVSYRYEKGHNIIYLKKNIT